MTAIQGLQVSLDQLVFQREPTGGGTVQGLIINKTLEAGATVRLDFTFYGAGGAEIGSLPVSLAVGAPDEALSFEAPFNSGPTSRSAKAACASPRITHCCRSTDGFWRPWNEPIARPLS